MYQGRFERSSSRFPRAPTVDATEKRPGLPIGAILSLDILIRSEIMISGLFRVESLEHFSRT